MPEGTKTNGQGILNIDVDIIKLIDDACNKDNLKINSIRFDHIFLRFSPYNTTDS
jgi:hypothetical protein